MYLESLGKLFFSKRGLTCFYLALYLPIIFAGSFLLISNSAQKELENEYFETARKAKSALGKKLRKERFLSRYGTADPYFLEEKIESIPLLDMERDFQLSRLDHPALAKKDEIKQRLHFLEKTNRISFLEENIRTSKRIKETDENMRHPVQVNAIDLQKILSRIEDVTIGSFEPIPNMPQLVVRNMKLKKKGELFELELQLIKREWSYE